MNDFSKSHGTQEEDVIERRLARLEAESLFILRETKAQFHRIALLYSIGKDSTVLVHLARKAFWPGNLPFPLIHIDTGWKFREMIEFRDRLAGDSDIDLHVHSNTSDLAVNPFTSDPATYTRVMKTMALRQALDHHGIEAAIGGARRDEEPSRAKERIFSVRGIDHQWEPRRQRPELWSILNGTLAKGESIRVFPLSNWTEIDIWRYIQRESLSVVPLYFSKERICVRRDNKLIHIDDPERMVYLPEDKPRMENVRFRSLGCWPLSAGVEESALDTSSIISVLENSQTSERSGRLIDDLARGNMEVAKQHGYF